MSTLFSFSVTFQDGEERLTITGRADGGSDESIVSAQVAERAVIKRVGKTRMINPITLRVALRTDMDAQKFTFLRAWTLTRTVLSLSPDSFALLNERYLVADASLAAEDMLISLPVLCHLDVDGKTLLKERRGLLNGSNCFNVNGKDLKCAREIISRLMVARLNLVSNESVTVSKSEDEDHDGSQVRQSRDSSVDYYRVCEKKDPFLDPSVLDPLDSDQKTPWRPACRPC